LVEDLEAALQLVLVVGAENAGKAPALLFDMRRVALGGRGRDCTEPDQRGEGGGDELVLEHGSHPDHACALPRTLSEMLVGSGLGVSMRDRTGRMTRK